jgi:hypothetical protein
MLAGFRKKAFMAGCQLWPCLMATAARGLLCLLLVIERLGPSLKRSKGGSK